MAAANDGNFRFGPFRLDMQCRRLLNLDREVSLPPKQYRVLHYLICHHGEARSFDEIRAACWPDVNVGPNSVSNAVYALRAIFVKGGGSAEWIQTVARYGYRFTPPLLSAPAAAPEATNDGSRHAGVAAPTDLFVGREAELERLDQCFAQVIRGVPATVFVSGEAGIGKSSLVRHFCAGVNPARVCIGRCIPPHREAEPYMPVLEALGSLDESACLVEIARQQAPTWLAQMPWLLAMEERASLGQTLTGGSSARMLREGKRLFAALAELGPLIVVIEDVHWADMATVDLIRVLTDNEQSGRLMLIATHRPRELGVHADPVRDMVVASTLHPRCTALPLVSLTGSEVSQYLERRFASASVAAELAPRLEERSGGNPLFLEAMTSSLCEQQGIVLQDERWIVAAESTGLMIGLPDRLREMIRTRLSRLSLDDRKILEAAAVAGMDFTSLDVAAGLDLDPIGVEVVCDNLVEDGQFLQLGGEVRWPDGSDGAGYRFAHAVYRDALLEDTPRHRCRLLNRRIGERLQVAFGERAREIAPRLAIHFEMAGDVERQIEFLGHSALLSARRYAHQEAVAYLDRVLEVLQLLPDDEARAVREVGYHVERSRLLMDWKGYAASLDSFARVVELAERQGNRFLEFFARVGCCLGQLMSAGRRSDHDGESETLLTIAADGHPELVALARVMAAVESDSRGDLVGAVSHAEAALAALPSSLQGIPRDFDLETLIRIALQSSLGKLGQLDRYRRERELAITGAEQRCGLVAKAHSFVFLACEALIAGEPSMALELAERGICYAREGDLDRYQTVGEAVHEAAHLASIADDQIKRTGLHRLAAAIGERRRTSEIWFNGLLAGALADGYRRRGDLDQARSCIDPAFDEAGVAYTAELWRIRGEIEAAFAAQANTPAERGSARDEASRCFRTALQVSRAHGTRLFELRAATALARFHEGADGTSEDLSMLLRSFGPESPSADIGAASAVIASLSALS